MLELHMQAQHIAYSQVIERRWWELATGGKQNDRQRPIDGSRIPWKALARVRRRHAHLLPTDQECDRDSLVWLSSQRLVPFIGRVMQCYGAGSHSRKCLAMCFSVSFLSNASRRLSWNLSSILSIKLTPSTLNRQSLPIQLRIIPENPLTIRHPPLTRQIIL